MTHTLKTGPHCFQLILDGLKTFGCRKNNRLFAVGDSLLLREYDIETDTYSGRELLVSVTYILDIGLGVIMSIKRDTVRGRKDL